MDNSYSQFIMTNLAVANDLIDKDEDYDIMWGEGGELLAEFEGSSYDVDSKSEIDCMVDFFNHKKRELKNKEKVRKRLLKEHKRMTLIGNLKHYYELDLENCLMTNADWIVELSKALTDKKYLKKFNKEYAIYLEERE